MARPYLLKKSDGTQQWFLNYNELHRLDGPALIKPDGTQVWYKNGKCHRVDGPAVESPGGSLAWYYNGLNHREDGAALEHNCGSRVWFYHGALHRVNGPAVHYIGGDDDDIIRWYLYGVEMTEEKYHKVMRTCRRVIEKFKNNYRNRLISVLRETEIFGEKYLCNDVAKYVI
jgi:hypothetical protein